MTASAVRPSSLIPAPRTPVSARPAPAGTRSSSETSVCPAVAYERVLHQLVRREWRLVGELATWAPPGEPVRTATLTRHADLLARVLLHHHAVEREAVWPALLRAVPADRIGTVRTAVVDWTDRCARIDHMLRDIATAGRQWQVACAAPARDAFARACLDVADTIDSQTAEEEAVLLSLLGQHLGANDWATIARSFRCRLSGPEQLLVLGLALEDSSAADRARLLSGLSPATRMAWRLRGRDHYRAAVVRLRGAPPAP